MDRDDRFQTTRCVVTEYDLFMTFFNHMFKYSHAESSQLEDKPIKG